MLSQPQAQPQTLSTPHSLSTTPTTTAPKIEKFNNHQKYAQCVNKNNATQKQNSQNNSSSNYSNGANQRRSSLNGNNQQATWNRRSSWFGGLASTERRHSLNPDAPPFIVNSDFNRFATNNSNSNSTTANIASKDNNNNKNQPKKQGYQNFNNSNNSNNTRRNSFGSYGSNNNKHYNNGNKNNNSRTNVYEAKFEGWLKNNDIRTETTFERNMSPISKSRKLNNWVKSVLIQKYVSKGDCVLDLGCGHGGDLLKFANRQISHYVGVDFAQNALSIAKERYLGIPTPPFAATFILHDSAQMCLTSLLDPTLSFDCVASQLALQYSYSNAESAKTYVHSAVDRLRHGGYFIGLIPDSQLLLDKLAQSSDGRTVSNPVYRVVFDKHRSELNLDTQPFGNLYRISIKNTLSEMPEYMVDMMSLEKMLNECGLELDLYMNVSDFYNSYAKVPQFTQLLHVMGVVDNYHPTVPKDQFELSCLFRVFVFKKQTCSKNTCKSKLSCNSDIVRENGICEKLTQSQNVGSQDSSR